MSNIIPFGTKVKDTINGFTGVVTARAEYINGVVSYLAEASAFTDNQRPAEMWIDEARIEKVEEPAATRSEFLRP
jgi:hypothetical protein